MKEHTLSTFWRIDGVNYRVIFLSPEPSFHLQAVRLVKPDGETYDMRSTPYGMECECMGYLQVGDCKHLACWRMESARLYIVRPASSAPPTERTHMVCPHCKGAKRVADPFAPLGEAQYMVCPYCAGVGGITTGLPPKIILI